MPLFDIPGGSAYLALRACERAVGLYAGGISFRETVIDIKHEGKGTACGLVPDAASPGPAKHGWGLPVRQFAVEQ